MIYARVSARAALVASVAGLALFASPALAQDSTQPSDAEEEAAAAGIDSDNDIVVTGSRIDRAGFDQPTPTTVLGEAEIQQAARPNLQQFLVDIPQVRPTSLPTAFFGSTATGTAPVDLRGLGSGRTLVLLNGRRFVGENNLNFVPTSLVQQLDIVTGGASAAYGSGAVAGVVNIILKRDLEGLSLGANTGISSRGDGERYGFEGSFGTSFAGGNGHFMIGGEYLKDKGIPPEGRLERHGTNPGGLVTINAQGHQMLVEDLNSPTASYAGQILSGVLKGQMFNNDGSLRTFRGPTPFGNNFIGGEDAHSTFDDTYLSSPSERISLYGRLSYDIGDATVWVDGSYGKVTSDYVFFPDFTTPGDISGPALTIQANNPFLSQSIRDQLAAAGQTSFTYGRTYRDIFPMNFRATRESKEGGIGIDGTFGNGWKYSAFFSHGEVDTTNALENSRLEPNFARAVNAVMSNGQIVCAVNADANPANDDPACRPLDIFGEGNASAEAIDYVTDTQATNAFQKLDSTGISLRGSPFSLWAGPVSIAVGAEARWEEQATRRDERTLQGGFGLPVFTAGNDIEGGFNVKEGFAEIVLPLLDVEEAKVEFNGAARYSDYSTSGGIWTWKAGGTARLFDDLLLRVTRSRDIRSPSIDQLFAIDRITIARLTDQDTEGRLGVIPGYTANPQLVTTHSGGNPNLTPEISNMLTLGATYSPSFIRGLRASVDYYDIEIKDALGSLGGSNLTLACKQGDQSACDRVIRDPVTQTVLEVFSNTQNIASFEQSGFDMELSYVMPMSQLMGDKPGSLRFRALATYIEKIISDNGLIVPPLNSVGTVGDLGGNPKWRAIFSAAYQDSMFGANLRVRYVGCGKFSKFADGEPNLATPNPNDFAPGHSAFLVNNDIGARTYVDVGVNFRVMDRFNFFGNVSNLFDKDAPISPQASAHYDVMGRYFTAGVKVNF